MKKREKQEKAITLVALIVTIIVLLILAGISIQAITNTGIFTQANNAKRESEIASIKEQIALDIYEKQLEPPLGSITDEQLETILGKYGTKIYEEDGVTIKGITTAKGYEILLKDIYGGETAAESVPDGAVVNPVNDITTWLKTGEISKQYSYTTIEQVIADSTCTESLMNNENAMKYLARSTEFANAICASETAMTSLGKSTYVDDTVLNSDLWVSSVRVSQYWESVFTTKYKIFAGASETITIDGVCGSFTTNADGTINHALPFGELTLHGSVSGESFTRTVTKDTTEVKVMPEGAIYWCGNECIDVTGGWTCYGMTFSGTYSTNVGVSKENNCLYFKGTPQHVNESIRTSNIINTLAYTKLRINIVDYSNINFGGIVVRKTLDTIPSNVAPFDTSEDRTNHVNGINVVGGTFNPSNLIGDISNIDSGYVVYSNGCYEGYTRYLKINKIWLE